MNPAEQLGNTTRMLDSLLRRLDVDYSEYADIHKQCVRRGRILTVEDLEALCTAERPRPALRAAIAEHRQRVAERAEREAAAAVERAAQARAKAGDDQA